MVATQSSRTVRWARRSGTGCGLNRSRPFAAAGLWKRDETPQGPLNGVTIADNNAEGHSVMGPMQRSRHEKRSVFILRPDDYDEWPHTTNVEAARAMPPLLPAEMMVDPLQT